MALSHRVRGMHSGDLFLAEKHPDDKHGEELKHADKNPGTQHPKYDGESEA
jgi:hypothetical protein